MVKETRTTGRGKGPRARHVPIRTCVICREKDAKRQYVRIVRTPEGDVDIDRTGKRNGRGAYLCSNYLCWERAASGTALDKALKAEVSDDVRTMIRHYADTHFRKDDAQ